MAESALERATSLGLNSVGVADLAAIGFSRRPEDVALAEFAVRELLQRLDSIRRLGELSPAELREHFGLEDFEVDRALALLELGRRTAAMAPGEKVDISSPEAVAQALSYLRRERKEHFVSLLLDSKNRILRRVTVHIGTVNMSVVGAREVFRDAIREGAASILVAHNHPSGDPYPSAEDDAITRKLADIGRQLDIPVIDHVIIGEPDFYSYRQMGKLL